MNEVFRKDCPESLNNAIVFLEAAKALAEACRVHGNEDGESQPVFAKARRYSSYLTDAGLLDDFRELYGASRINCAWLSQRHSDEVTGIQVRFRESAARLIPGAHLCERPKVETKLRPDAWVVMEGLPTPVEVKPKVFDGKALKQLLGYMEVCGTTKGVAVAPRLTCELPDTILFIACE